MKNEGYFEEENLACPDEFSLKKHRFTRLSLISLLFGITLISGLTIWQEPNLLAFVGHRPMTMLEHSGGVLLDASQVENHIPLPIHGAYSRYWIGSVAGNRYTTNCVTPRILQVNYFGPDQTLANQVLVDGILPRTSVTAYENMSVYNTHTHFTLGDSIINFKNSRGETLAINTTSQTEVMVGPLQTQEVITLRYSSPQSIATMVRDSESLTKL